MTDPDDIAIEALRRLDRPHDPDEESLERMEALVLGRFDDVAAAGDVIAESPAELVELHQADTPTRRRRSGLWIGLAAAAAVVALLGAVLLLRTNAVDVEVPSTQPASIVEDASIVEEQVRAYCREFVVPVVQTWTLWNPVGFDSEERTDLLVALEQAAQGLVDLARPAADQFQGRDLALLQLATDARRASTLDRGADEALIIARDALFAELEASSVAVGLSECSPNCEYTVDDEAGVVWQNSTGTGDCVTLGATVGESLHHGA